MPGDWTLQCLWKDRGWRAVLHCLEAAEDPALRLQRPGLIVLFASGLGILGTVHRGKLQTHVHCWGLVVSFVHPPQPEA